MLDSAIEWLDTFARKSPGHYSTLESTMGPRTLVHRTGVLATLLQYEGVAKVVGNTESAVIADALTKALNPFLLRKAHDLQFVMNRDLNTAERVKKRIAPMYESAARLGVKDMMTDIFDEQAATMARLTMDDTLTIVLYTHPIAMRPEDFKNWAKQQGEERRRGSIHVPPGSQDETYGIDPLLALHDAFVDQVYATLTSKEIAGQIEILDAGRASNVMARSLDPMGVSDEWSAWLLPTFDERFGNRVGGEPLTKAPPHGMKKAMPKIVKVANTTVYLPPPIRDQLLVHEATYPKKGFVEYAGRLYATLSMIIPPRRAMHSMPLIYNLSNMQSRADGEKSERVPYRLSMRMRGNGLKQAASRAMLAPLVSWASYNNRKLMQAYKALAKEVSQDNAVGSLSLSLTTWVNASDPKAHERLTSRVVALRSAASQWGDMTITEENIDRFSALVASCPGLTTDPNGNEAVGSLDELLPLFPWGRPASPLGRDGTELYRSLDGAMLPTASHSSKQDFWLETMTAPMGGGKSVQANRKHLDFVFAPGRTGFPFLHIMDIGGSVSGLVDLIRDALPEDRKHLAYMMTLRNSREHAINMLDTKLGLRRPLEGDLATTVDWLTALVTPAERIKAYDNMGEFCRAVLLATYRRLDDTTDNGSPKPYKKGHPVIIAALERHRIDEPHGSTWFGVADLLGSHGEYQAALYAHRLAMPLMADLQATANDPNIKDDFSKALAENGTPIPDVFSVQLTLARDAYPIFSDPTVVDLRSSRITAIDLQEVALLGNAQARKQSSIMYLVAYEIFQRNMRITEEDLVQIPANWIPYYQRLIEELKNTEKHVSIDEYHRTQIVQLSKKDSADHDTTGIRQTLVREGGRESRKWGLSLLTISQVTSDHGALFSLASANHIMRIGSPEETETQRDALNLSDADISAMSSFSNGPSRAGVTFLSQWVTKEGRFNQMFTSSMGPTTLWSLCTTFEDKNVRKIVFDQLGRTAGRAVLAYHYPGGSAVAEVTRRKQSVKTDDNTDIKAAACNEVAFDLVRAYKTHPSNYK